MISMPDFFGLQALSNTGFSFLKQFYFVNRIELLSKAVLMVALMESSLIHRLHCSVLHKNADKNIRFLSLLNYRLPLFDEG